MSSWITELFQKKGNELHTANGSGARVGSKALGNYWNTGGLDTSQLDGMIGSEFAGTRSQARKGYALSPDTIMQADMQRQLNIQSYSDDVEGMRQAGLNPALMYGGAGSQTSPATVQESAALTPAESMGGVGTLFDMLKGVADTGINAAIARSQIDNTDADTKNKQFQFNLDTETRDSLIRIRNGEAEQKDLVNAGLALENILKDIDSQIAQKYGFTNAAFQSRMLEFNSRIAESDSEFRDRWNEAMIELYEAQAQNNRMGVIQAWKSIEKMGAEIGLINENAKYVRKTIFAKYALALSSMIGAISGMQSESGGLNLKAGELGLAVNASETHKQIMDEFTGLLENLFQTLETEFGDEFVWDKDRKKGSLWGSSNKGSSDEQWEQLPDGSRRMTTTDEDGSPIVITIAPKKGYKNPYLDDPDRE